LSHPLKKSDIERWRSDCLSGCTERKTEKLSKKDRAEVRNPFFRIKINNIFNYSYLYFLSLYYGTTFVDYFF